MEQDPYKADSFHNSHIILRGMRGLKLVLRSPTTVVVVLKMVVGLSFVILPVTVAQWPE